MTDDQTADECGICLDTLTAAVTLPCTHKFCASCLDGWKSKFGSSLKEERSKSCPLCRKKIPPSKDMLIQLDFFRKEKLELEARGLTHQLEQVKEMEAEIGDYDGKGLDYDDYECIELPEYIFKAMKTNDNKRIMRWLGSPVDMKKLSARYPEFLNSTLVHIAVYSKNSDLLSILLQYGADINALDAKGWSPLFITSQNTVDLAKILLEWGVEISLPRPVSQVQKECGLTNNRKEFAETMKKDGNIKLANLISSEFGGRRCEVINLPNHPQLNGKACVVEKYIMKKDKYKIIFEGLGNVALVGPNNLKRRDRTPLDCGYFITFKNGRMSRREFATKEECQAYEVLVVWRCKGDRGGVGRFEAMRFHIHHNHRLVGEESLNNHYGALYVVRMVHYHSNNIRRQTTI